MRFSLLAFLLFFVLVPSVGFAQLNDEQIKTFLKTNRFDIDTEANAIVLLDRTDLSYFVENQKWICKRKVTQVIKIINNKALYLANVRLYSLRHNLDSYVGKIKGKTYNLVGGAVVESKLTNELIKTDKESKVYDETNFALPQAREGSIIEYSYERTSRFSGVAIEIPWTGEYPKLVSVVSVENTRLPEINAVNNIHFTQETFHSSAAALGSESPFTYWTNGIDLCLWCRKKIPAFKREPLSLSYANYQERIELHFEAIQSPGNSEEGDSWRKYTEREWASKLAAAIRKNNTILDPIVTRLAKNDTGKLSVMKKIFRYVQDSFTVVQEHDVVNANAQQSMFVNMGEIGDYLATKTVSQAQANILLAALLNKAGLTTYFLYTGEQGERSASPDYMSGNRLTHLACAMSYGDAYIFLDAGEKFAVPGILPLSCYNGYARIISEQGDFLSLNHGMLQNSNKTAIRIYIKNDTTQVVEYTTKLDLLESSLLRREHYAAKTSAAKFLEHYCAYLGFTGDIVSKNVENWANADTNLYIKITAENRWEPGKDVYIINSDVDKPISANPFVAETRTFPIEYPFRSFDDEYITISVPKGYTIDSTYPPVFYTFGNDGIMYSKLIGYDAETGLISIKVSLKTDKTVFKAEEYAELRKFYTLVMQDEARVIGLKKQ